MKNSGEGMGKRWRDRLLPPSLPTTCPIQATADTGSIRRDPWGGASPLTRTRTTGVPVQPLPAVGQARPASSPTQSCDPIRAQLSPRRVPRTPRAKPPKGRIRAAEGQHDRPGEHRLADAGLAQLLQREFAMRPPRRWTASVISREAGTAGDSLPSARCSDRVREAGATIPRPAAKGPVVALPHTSDFSSTWRFLLSCEGTCRYLPMACGVRARLNRIPGHFSSTWQRVRCRRAGGDALPRATVSCRSPNGKEAACRAGRQVGGGWQAALPTRRAASLRLDPGPALSL